MEKTTMTENFFEIENAPTKIRMSLEKLGEHSSIVVVQAIFELDSNHPFGHQSDPFEYIFPKGEQHIFKTFCELYIRAFKQRSYAVFNTGDINYILEIAKMVSGYEFEYGFEYYAIY